MNSARERGPLSADGPSSGWLPTLSGREEVTDERLRAAVRHLTVAASQLARDPSLPPEVAARFAAAETRFRSRAFDRGVLDREVDRPEPVVRLDDDTMVTLSRLFASLCRRDRWLLPIRSIEPDLICAARELLTGLDWFFPDEAR
jgi:hypothetical protein